MNESLQIISLILAAVSGFILNVFPARDKNNKLTSIGIVTVGFFTVSLTLSVILFIIDQYEKNIELKTSTERFERTQQKLDSNLNEVRILYNDLSQFRITYKKNSDTNLFLLSKSIANIKEVSTKSLLTLYSINKVDSNLKSKEFPILPLKINVCFGIPAKLEDVSIINYILGESSENFGHDSIRYYRWLITNKKISSEEVKNRSAKNKNPIFELSNTGVSFNSNVSNSDASSNTIDDIPEKEYKNSAPSDIYYTNDSLFYIYKDINIVSVTVPYNCTSLLSLLNSECAITFSIPNSKEYFNESQLHSSKNRRGKSYEKSIISVKSIKLTFSTGIYKHNIILKRNDANAQILIKKSFLGLFGKRVYIKLKFKLTKKIMDQLNKPEVDDTY